MDEVEAAQEFVQRTELGAQRRSASAGCVAGSGPKEPSSCPTV